MKPLLVSLFITISSGTIAFTQDDARTARDRALFDKVAEKNENPVPARINVGENVRASAVLIPRVDARRIFGKEIADNYAVIEVNVGNKSRDAALIIHGVFIDYSRWALKGGGGTDPPSADDDVFQASTHSDQVASEEYRVVRGQLLDAQMWSQRNWTMRLLTLAGNLAGAYPFPLNARGVKELGVFSGVFVPGVKEAWPDGTIEQLNRISDFGYQTNKVIARESAEVIVCFFPIDRFLTSGLKKLYLKSPALFFAPLQMLVDKKMQKEVTSALNLGIARHTGESLVSFEDLNDALPCYMSISLSRKTHEKTPDFDQCVQELHLQDVSANGRVSVKAPPEATFYRKLDFINHVSLNNVTIVVDGVMSVDTSSIAAKIEDVTFDQVADCTNPSDPACFWANLDAEGGVRKGTLTGSYLTGGNIGIADPSLGITDLKTISEGASDQTLHFSFKLTKAIPPETNLTFSVTKPKAGSSTERIVSTTRVIPVRYTIPAPEITSVKLEEGSVTVSGTRFYDIPGFERRVTLHLAGDGDQVVSKLSSSSSTKLVFAAPTDSGCWNVTLSVSNNPSSAGHSKFLILPTIENHATIDGDRLILDGEGLDAVDCDDQGLVFTLIKGTAKKLPDVQSRESDEVSLKLPKDVDVTWKLRVQFAGKDLSGSPIELKAKQ